ncbi:MAG: agmatine/peptidylarginine deiminase [Anaerolineae bacterium]
MSRFKHISARAAGFRMPAEWEPHECCWMAWPASPAVWGEMLPRTQHAYAQVANAIAGFEPVRMLTPPAHVAQSRALCDSGVEIIDWDLDDAWMRDIGPNFVRNEQGEVAASIFHFNAWGRKYRRYRKDAALGHRMAEALGMRSFSAPLFMEGGGINTDGEGTLLTTEQCVLNENRNPDISREEAEHELCEALGMERVIWLRGDPADQETDGHVDGIACFTRPGVVLAEPDPSAAPGTEHHDILQENQDILRNSVDARGRRLDVHLIQAGTQMEVVGDRFCRSYVNFYIANGGIVLPAYGVPDEDCQALEAVQGCFPEHTVVQVDVNAIAYGGGSIHCITQQQPLAARSERHA